MNAIDTAIAAMPAQATRARRRDVKAGALLMIRPGCAWRIQRALYGMALGPLPEDIPTLLRLASRRAEGMRAAGLIGHWSYSLSRHVASQQAALALRYLRRRGLTSIAEREVA